MQQRIREVVVGHLEPIVEDPEGSTITLRDTRETTARTSVRLEHDKRQTGRLSEPSGLSIVPHKFNNGLMGQEGMEVLLRIVVSTNTEGGETIVVGVPVIRQRVVRTAL